MSSFEGKVNIYVCKEGHKTITIDSVEGVTPFLIKCRCTGGCDELAQSSMYRVDQAQRPGYEWYKPDKKEFNNLDEGMKDHVNRGGLLLRRVRMETLEKFGLGPRVG